MLLLLEYYKEITIFQLCNVIKSKFTWKFNYDHRIFEKDDAAWSQDMYILTLDYIALHTFETVYQSLGSVLL